MSTFQMSGAWTVVARAAQEQGLPEPWVANVGRYDVGLHLSSVADLAQWAQWAEATISSFIYDDGKTSRHYRAEGSIYDLPVTLVAVEQDVTPETYDCHSCNQRVIEKDSTFEAEVARHQVGACFGAVVA